MASLKPITASSRMGIGGMSTGGKGGMTGIAKRCGVCGIEMLTMLMGGMGIVGTVVQHRGERSGNPES